MQTYDISTTIRDDWIMKISASAPTGLVAKLPTSHGQCSSLVKDDLLACGGRRALMKFCLIPRAVDRVLTTRLADAFSLTTALKLAPPRLCAKNRRTAITVSGFGRWSVDSTAPICAGSHQVVVACAWRQSAFVAFSRSCLDGSFVAFSLPLSLSPSHSHSHFLGAHSTLAR